MAELSSKCVKSVFPCGLTFNVSKVFLNNGFGDIDPDSIKNFSFLDLYFWSSAPAPCHSVVDNAEETAYFFQRGKSTGADRHANIHVWCKAQ